MRRNLAFAILASFCLLTSSLPADGPSDNIPAKVRRVPKLGVEVPEEKRKELETGLVKLRKEIDEIKKRGDSNSRELWLDVEIFYKSVHDALVYQEFFDASERSEASRQQEAGLERASALRTSTSSGRRKPASSSVRAAVWAGDSGKLQPQRAAAIPHGPVVPRPWRSPQRAELSTGPDE